MREILFRGKRTINGDWVEGNLFIPDLPNTATQILIGTNIYRIPYDVIPSTVGQYTGLTDKNGKKIFEGDILKFCTELKEICFVDYGKGKYILRQLKKDKHLSWQSIDIFELFDLECKVIGNIHDNPELLERSKGND